MSEEGSVAADRVAVVLDYLPRGRADDDRPQYQKSPLAHAIDSSSFKLYEVVLDADFTVSIDDEITVEPAQDGIEDVRAISFDDLSGGGKSELEYVVKDLVEADIDRYVEFYNEAGPITLRLHQLNLLPGIGDKLRDNIQDARDRSPFDSLDDLEDRIPGLHEPKGIIVDRIIEEIRDEDVKYKLFARDE
jgi:putative nucleotide binding protein